MQHSLRAPSCLLPFQNGPVYQANTTTTKEICQTPEEGWAAFRQFQQAATGACQPPCTQLSTDLQHAYPQFFSAHYMPNVSQAAKVTGYHLSLPRAVKVSVPSHSYGFVSYIAEVAGWYNLFLGGSVLALWEGLWLCATAFLGQIGLKADRLVRGATAVFMVVAGVVLAYILVDCITTLATNPIETSTSLRTRPSGLSLSVCLPQFTSLLNVDRANTTEFWARGNNLSNRIAELSVRGSGTEWVSLWNRSLPEGSALGRVQLNRFQAVNIISSERLVHFCHTLDLTGLPYAVSQVLVRAVNDVILVIHLAGQLLQSHSYYYAVNPSMLGVTKDILLYGSEVSLQLEKSSLKNVSSPDCELYNASWTYDNCLLDFALRRIENKQQDHLRGLLRPNGTRVDAG